MTLKNVFYCNHSSKIKYSSSANCKENGFANWLSGGFQGRTYTNKPHPLRIHKVNHRRDDNRAIIYTCKIRCGSERKPVSSPPAHLLRESKTAFLCWYVSLREASCSQSSTGGWHQCRQVKIKWYSSQSMLYLLGGPNLCKGKNELYLIERWRRVMSIWPQQDAVVYNGLTTSCLTWSETLSAIAILKRKVY